jgi:hypothetical protein
MKMLKKYRFHLNTLKWAQQIERFAKAYEDVSHLSSEVDLIVV